MLLLNSHRQGHPKVYTCLVVGDNDEYNTLRQGYDKWALRDRWSACHISIGTFFYYCQRFGIIWVFLYWSCYCTFRWRFRTAAEGRFWLRLFVSAWQKTARKLTFEGGLKSGRKTCIHRGSFRKKSVKIRVFLRFVKDWKNQMLDYQALKGWKGKFFPLFLSQEPPTALRGASENGLQKSAICRANVR